MTNRRLKAARVLKGYTQAALGARAGGLDKATISRIEAGVTPRPEHQRAIACALGVPVDILWPATSEIIEPSEILGLNDG